MLGSAETSLPADPNDATLVPLRLDVVSLQRLEGMVELRVALTNDGPADTPEYQPYSYFDDPRLPGGDGAYSFSGAMLVDGEAQKAYLVIVDADGVCLCTRRMDQVAVPSGGSVTLAADFGGVPDDLDEIDVQVPGFPTVAAVPIG